MTPPRMALTTEFERKELVILRGSLPGQMGAPVIVFVSGGESISKQPRPEFLEALSRLGRPTLFVIDGTLCWYARPGVADEIEAHIRDEMAACGVAQVDTLGFSMGGFGAVAFAERVPVRFALAMAPRYTPDPAIVYDKRHYNRLAALSGRFPFARLDDGMAKAEAGLILTGMQGPDLPHMAETRVPKHFQRWLMPEVGHGVAKALRDNGHLAGVILAALGAPKRQDALAEALAQAGAIPDSRMPVSLRLKLIRHRIRNSYRRWRPKRPVNASPLAQVT